MTGVAAAILILSWRGADRWGRVYPFCRFRCACCPRAGQYICETTHSCDARGQDAGGSRDCATDTPRKYFSGTSVMLSRPVEVEAIMRGESSRMRRRAAQAAILLAGLPPAELFDSPKHSRLQDFLSKVP